MMIHRAVQSIRCTHLARIKSDNTLTLVKTEHFKMLSIRILEPMSGPGVGKLRRFIGEILAFSTRQPFNQYRMTNLDVLDLKYDKE